MENKNTTKWMQQIFEIYDRMRNRGDSEIYEVECNGLNLKVHKNVYSPDLFSDSIWFSNELPGIVCHESLLEVGTGTGIIGISCALNGAKVVLTDVNPDAVGVAKENAKRYDPNIQVREGDIYDPVDAGEKFDYIFWSHPYNNWDEPVEDMLLRSGLDHNYEGLRKYIKGASSHLKPNGKLLLGTGNTADLPTIVKVANENGYSIRILKASEMPLAVGDKGRIINMIFQFDR